MLPPSAAFHVAPSLASRQLYHDYLAQRANENLSYGRLAADALRVLEALEPGVHGPSTDPVTAQRAFALLARPLLRQGLLDFRGRGKYGLSGTEAYRADSGCVLLVNYPNAASIQSAEVIAPGLVWLAEANVHSHLTPSAFRAEGLLTSMPPLDLLVRESPVFGDAGLRQPSASWEVLTATGYVPGSPADEESRVQLYRASGNAGANRYLRLDGEIYTVPSTQAHPGAYPLALLLRDATKPVAARFRPIFSFEPNALTVLSDFFPAELERVLWLASTLHTGISVDSFAARRTYVLPPTLLGQLRRILLQNQ